MPSVEFQMRSFYGSYNDFLYPIRVFHGPYWRHAEFKFLIFSILDTASLFSATSRLISNAI